MPNPERRLLWSPESESNLLNIWHWGARHFSYDIADKHLRDISNAAQNLCAFPETGRIREDLLTGLRSVVIYRLSCSTGFPKTP